MKKIIAGLSGLLIMLFVFMLFTNAVSKQEPAKTSGTEMTQKCMGATSCPMASNTTEKCKEKGCEKKNCQEGKCDPSTCKMKNGGKCMGTATMENKTCGKECPMAKK